LIITCPLDDKVYQLKTRGLAPRSQNLNWKKLIIKKRLETILRVKHWMAKGGDKNV